MEEEIKIYKEMIKKLGKELEKRTNDTAENWIVGTYIEARVQIKNEEKAKNIM